MNLPSNEAINEACENYSLRMDDEYRENASEDFRAGMMSYMEMIINLNPDK